MSIPRATARLQLHQNFPFDAASEIVPYLARLGISHVYASPILAARPGSTHGYDTIDPTMINPELGGEAGLGRLSEALRRHEMGMIIDIVPNHMAAVAENPWWWDVLRFGRASRYAYYFDIDWEDPDPTLHGKVLLPCLGDKLEACLARGEITIVDEDGERTMRYFDQSFPVALRSGKDADPRTLLQNQNYVLSFWNEAATRINWRRFFDINQLVALRMDREEVFQDYHRLIIDLRKQSIIAGVRVDHVDGMADPAAYCRRLRAALDGASGGNAGHAYIVVEKILHGTESLRRDWSVDGTTGYDFMDQIGAVLHGGAAEPRLDRLWRDRSGDIRSFAAIAGAARREIVQRYFPKSLQAILTLLKPGALDTPQDVLLHDALVALLAAGTRYRTYGDASGLDEEDRTVIDRARLSAIAEKPSVGPAIDWICRRLREAVPALVRFQQLHATLTAKAVEDTAFYRFGRLLSRNEVGSDPSTLAITMPAFHALCARRGNAFPDAMLATATHDHKRGEDARMRIAVLSEMPELWEGFVNRWLPGLETPDPAVALMLWQSVIGAWPLSLKREDGAGLMAFQARLKTWLIKALREAKVKTAWDSTDQDYEQRCIALLQRTLDPKYAESFSSTWPPS